MNRLSSSPSAYLRQHAADPVHWQPWSAEAFSEAQRRDVPVFISIGYAACHWCHVMASESFNDPDIAATLNASFVSIKVDREEHPEVDAAYMAAVQGLTGQGGWPMSIFATPQGQTFHAGLYFPARRRGSVVGFDEVLTAVDEAWQQRREQVLSQAQEIASVLGSQRHQHSALASRGASADDVSAADASADNGVNTQAGDDSHDHLDPIHLDPITERSDVVALDHPETTNTQLISAEVFRTALRGVQDQADLRYGGYGGAPKFPPTPLLKFLLEHSSYDPHSPALDHATMTLETMAHSALYDQVEGGFARYATDVQWKLPHFEKMLYDNAQLLGVYALLSRHDGVSDETRRRAESTARGVISWLRLRMRTEPAALLASSLDADTVTADGAHHEGSTYLFSTAELRDAAAQSVAASVSVEPGQVDELLELLSGVPVDPPGQHLGQQGQQRNGADAPSNAGDMEADGGAVEDTLPRTLHFSAPLSPDQQQLWEPLRAQLATTRAERAQPQRDDKAVASWNAQAICSMIQAATLWHDQDLLSEATQLAESLWSVHTQTHQAPEGAGERVRVFRTSYQGKASQRRGTLDDHAQVAYAALHVAEALDSADWLARAQGVIDEINDHTQLSQISDPDWALPDQFEHDAALYAAQNGPSYAGFIDGPEPSSIAALALALQRAQALELSVPATPEQLLHHLPQAAETIPANIGGSLLAGWRTSVNSPALQVQRCTPEQLIHIRADAARYGIPVQLGAETIARQTVQEEQSQHAAPPPQVSICVHSQLRSWCGPAHTSVAEAMSSLPALPH